MYKLVLCLLLACLCQQVSGCGKKKLGGCGVSYFCQKALPCCGNGLCQADEGENCETCPEDCGECASCEGICGNHLCDVTESPCSCPEDCGPCCCDGVCSGPENYLNCPLECGGSAYFMAVDSLSGNPLAGVNVTCYTSNGPLPELFTDYDGTVVFGELAPAEYTCQGTLQGYYDNSAAFEVLPGKTASVPKLLSLTKQVTGSITGYVVFNLTGYPSGILREVNVSCGDQDTLTDREGRFVFYAIPPGPTPCNAAYPGYATTRFTANVTVGNNTDTKVPLTPLPSTLTFTVTDAQALSPAVGVNVMCNSTGVATNAPGWWSVTGTTSSTGSVTLAGLYAQAGAPVVCWFGSGGYVSDQWVFFPSWGQTEAVDVQLTKAAV